ncbi:MAG: DUF3987 domain-containing protein [Phycisphaeraceae bacterium]|nr:MAG: DUF3987 domain-containing protein [Phycisphaeraceae bacterium]
MGRLGRGSARRKRDFGRLAHEAADRLDDDALQELADSLNVAPEALEALGFGDDGAGGYAWPERDGAGAVVGVGVRDSNGKRCYPGSKRGLIFDAATVEDGDDPLIIVEGGSDCAAGLSLGLRAVGIPQAGGTGDSLRWLCELLGRIKPTSVIVVGDADSAGERGAAKVAHHLAGRIKAPVHLAPTPRDASDLRDLLGRMHAEGLDLADAEGRQKCGADVLDELVAAPVVSRDDGDEDEPEAPAWGPFPTDALPRAAADMVRHSAASMQVDEGMVGPLVLTTISAAIGNSRVVQLSSSWCEPAILWTAVVAPSGTGKSPALEMATRPAEQRDGESFDVYEELRKEHEAALIEHKRSRSKLAAPDPPPCERFVTNDTTFEALAAMLSESPRGLLLACDELASWLGGFTRYSGGNGRPASESSRWLPMHRAGPLKVDRKTSKRLRIKRAALNIAGLIQPGVLATALNATDFDSGLVARLLMAMPPTPARKWSPRGLSAAVAGAYAAMIGRLYALDMPEGERGEPLPRELPLDDEAGRVWADYYDALNADLAGQDDQTRAMLSKLEGGAARLALVIHLGRLAGGEGVAPDRIDGESMRRGVALAIWFRREAERIYARLAEGPEDAEQRELIRWIRARGCVTPRELARTLARFAGKGGSDKAKEALGELAKAGLGTIEYPDGRTMTFTPEPA